MSKYDTAMNIMSERFGKDSLIAVATTDGKRLYNRVICAYYEGSATYALSNKMKQIALHPEVAVCAVDWFSGHGNGRNLGSVIGREVILKKYPDTLWDEYDYIMIDCPPTLN